MLKLKKRPKSPFWIARGTIGGRRIEESTGCRSYAEAKARLRSIAQKHTADQVGAEGLTFMQALEIYRDAHPNARFLAPLERHFFGHLVSDITNAEMRRAANILYPRAAPATIRRQVYTPVKAIINCAAEDDLCSAPKLKAPSGGNKRTVFFMPEQAEGLIDALNAEANVYLAPMVTFLFGQGCRMGDAIKLDGTDVSLANRLAIFRDPKNGQERRVTLISRVVAALSTLPTIGVPGPVFRRLDGYPFRSGGYSGGQIKEPFARAVRSIGMDEARYTPHICRHSWATWFYAQTTDVRRLKDEGGWLSGEWQRYTRIGTPELGRSAAEHGWNFREAGEKWGSENEIRYVSNG